TTETTQNITVNATDTYGVTITAANDCTSYCEINVTVYDSPTCNITASPDSSVCEGTDVNLTENGGDAVSWNWTTTETTQNITVNATGTYGVTITDANDCTSYCEINVTVYDSPTCNITASPDSSVCEGTDVNLTENGGDAVSWNWTTTETTQNITVNATGTYGVTITAANDC
ncbi:unnamed protein product, partial [marine sediment metagenome]